MSYTNERDEIADPFGVLPSPRDKGYSEEFDHPDLATHAPQALSAPSAAEAPAPLPLPEIKKPVKLRPPAHVEPHPHDTPPPRRPEAIRPVPQAPLDSLPGNQFDDEEFLVYEEDDLPDFSDFDFLPVEKETAPAPRVKQAPMVGSNASRPPVLTPVPASTPASPAAGLAMGGDEERSSGTRQATPTQTAPSPAPIPASVASEPRRRGRPERREDLHFESDQSLAHDDTSASLLETRGLVKIYDGRTVVNGVDIRVRPGEIVGLLGPNGAGKTTSFYMIVGLVPPNGGQVLFNGNDVTHMPMYKRARLGMGYLPQEESIFRKLTVEENLMAVLETLDLSRKDRLARCQDLLERFSITHIRKNVALTCSGGEKRRLTIARSLVTTPSLLMLDEPFSGVDPIAVNEIQNIVEDLRKSGLAILITDHNARQTLELVDRAYLIYEGRVLREGTRDFLINDPVSRELYLGDRFTM